WTARSPVRPPAWCSKPSRRGDLLRRTSRASGDSSTTWKTTSERKGGIGHDGSLRRNRAAAGPDARVVAPPLPVAGRPRRGALRGRQFPDGPLERAGTLHGRLRSPRPHARDAPDDRARPREPTVAGPCFRAVFRPVRAGQLGCRLAAGGDAFPARRILRRSGALRAL